MYEGDFREVIWLLNIFQYCIAETLVFFNFDIDVQLYIDTHKKAALSYYRFLHDYTNLYCVYRCTWM